MQANKDKTVQIQANEANYYHVRFTKHIPSGRKTKPQYHLQIFNKRDYQSLVRTVDRQGIDILGWHEMEVVHDPVLQAEIEERQFQETLKKEAEAKKKAEADAKKKADAEAKAKADAEKAKAEAADKTKATGRPKTTSKTEEK